jgi:hypothetical protein
MNKPVFRVVGLDHATCEDDYRGAETRTKQTSSSILAAESSMLSQAEPDTIRVRLGDVLPVLQASNSARLAWVHDFHDDPVVITKDLYEVLLTYRRLNNAA